MCLENSALCLAEARGILERLVAAAEPFREMSPPSLPSEHKARKNGAHSSNEPREENSSSTKGKAGAKGKDKGKNDGGGEGLTCVEG